MQLDHIVKAPPLNLPLTMALTLATLLLAACGSGGDNSSAEDATPAQASAVNGSVHGGQSPVSGSTVTLYAAGSGLAGASVLATTTSDANGNWSFSSYTCPSASTATYLIASGGNPGMAAGTNNSALKLAAALGACGSLPDTVNIDEVTTVAAAYALNGFTGPNGCVDCTSGVPTSVGNVHGKNPGLTNAMGNAARLANVTIGLTAAALPSAAACAASSPPANCSAVERLNSLANSLAACVNSSGPGSPQCVELFNCATPGATFSSGACTVPGGSSLAADTLTAALEIARNPAQVPVAGVYDVATRNPVFSPALGSAPTDWTLALNITGGGLTIAPSSQSLAIDAAGNVWVANIGNNSLSEFSPAGVPLSGSNGYTGGGLTYPKSLAIDASGNVWVANEEYGLSKFSATGAPISGSSGYTGGGVDGGAGYVAIDTSGNVWAVGGGVLAEFSSAGAALSGSSGYSGGGLYNAYGLAIDASGNVWTPNENSSGGSSLIEFSAAGAVLSGSSGYTGGGLGTPEGLAIDASGNIWVDNYTQVQLAEFSSAGTPLSGSGGYTGGRVGADFGVAIDGGGNVWLASYGFTAISEFNSAGTALSGSNGYTGGGLYSPSGIAIDPSGDVWTVNESNTSANAPASLTEVIGAAVPTRTPLVNAIKNGFTP